MKYTKYAIMLNDSGNVHLKESGFVYSNRKSFTDIEELAKFFGDDIGIRNQAEEYVYCACFNVRMNLIGCFEVSHGSASSSLIPIRETLTKALLIGADVIAICHNHPSGSLQPSDLDVKATKKLLKACKTVEIELIDHFIISQTGFFSFRQHTDIIK